MNNKEKYREICKAEKTIPIFSQDWWMDAVCGENNWDVLIVEKGEEIVASMPIYIKQKYGLKYITQPKLTQTNGIHIRYPENQKYEKRLSYEKEVMNEIIMQLEQFDIVHYQQSFHYSVTNWLPFYWKGFEQSTKYTYVIENLSDLDKVYSSFGHAKRKNIKKASKEVEVKFDLCSEKFYENHKMTLKKQNSEISYSYELFKKIYNYSYKNDAGKTIYAVDKDGNMHGALFFVWDGISAYDLISTIDPDYRNFGAASLLVYEAIKYVADKIKKFDFEGSMIENVENSFRQFGAIQKPYFVISKAFKYKFLTNMYKSLRKNKV